MEQDLKLIEAARAGNEGAFAGLYKTVYKDLYRFALYTLKNEADAEDAVSETVLDAYASIHKLRKAEAFRAWIFQILSNKCKNRMREYARKHVDLEEAGELPGEEPELADSLYLRSVFAKLTDEERLIIGMHVFGGYTGREIAGILHMNANTVRTKESRALKKMAKQLEDREVRI